jgi:hypothetical protein
MDEIVLASAAVMVHFSFSMSVTRSLAILKAQLDVSEDLSIGGDASVAPAP